MANHPVYDGVEARVTAISFTWRLYNGLYLKDDSAAGLMNGVAPAFFAHLFGALSDSLILGVAVLADPAKDRKYENLSFPRLLEEAESLSGRSNAFTNAECLWRTFEGQAAPFRLHRHKRIAHPDLSVHLAANLPDIYTKDLEEAIGTAFELTNALASLVGATTSQFDGPIMLGDSESLLEGLKRGRKAIEIEQWVYSDHPELRSIPEYRTAILQRFFDRGNWLVSKT